MNQDQDPTIHARFHSEGHWLNCQTFILDDRETARFLDPTGRAGLPHTTFLVNGVYHSMIEGANKTRKLEARLQSLIKEQRKRVKR